MPEMPGSLRGAPYPFTHETVNRNRPLRRAIRGAVTGSRDEPALADRIRRWKSENSADTRVRGGPDGRVYAVPFAEVWDELLRMVERRGRWTLEHMDEELGIITVSCRTPVFRFVDDMTVWVSLDADGLTRVEALSRSRVGKGDLGVNARRIEKMLRRLDAAVGPANRLQDRRSGGRPAQPPPGRPSGSTSDGATFA